MNRKAILIGASPPSDPLQFVSLDVATWYNFLLDPVGGAWLESELIDGSHFSKNQLQELLADFRHCDYSLIIFAGHGFTVDTELPWTELNLVLESGETILERELNSGSPRCCVILDCCRARGENIEVVLEHTKSASVEDAYKCVLARGAFHATLDAAEMGVVSIYATGDNATAADYKSFSQHIIYGAAKWAREHEGILPMDYACAIGADLLSQTYPQQKAQYNGGRRLRHFPFAISV